MKEEKEEKLRKKIMEVSREFDYLERKLQDFFGDNAFSVELHKNGMLIKHAPKKVNYFIDINFRKGAMCFEPHSTLEILKLDDLMSKTMLNNIFKINNFTPKTLSMSFKTDGLHNLSTTTSVIPSLLLFEMRKMFLYFNKDLKKKEQDTNVLEDEIKLLLNFGTDGNFKMINFKITRKRWDEAFSNNRDFYTSKLYVHLKKALE